MKICRYDDNRFGIVRDDVVYDVTSVVEAELPAYRYPLPIGDQLIVNLKAMRPKLEQAADSADGKPIADVEFRSPVANPTKIIGVPQNYEDLRKPQPIPVFPKVYRDVKWKTKAFS